jgi:hypothetical protein
MQKELKSGSADRQNDRPIIYLHQMEDLSDEIHSITIPTQPPPTFAMLSFYLRVL